MRKYGKFQKYKKIRAKIRYEARDLSSLSTFSFSNWWITKLKREAGVLKQSQKKELFQKKVFQWIRKRGRSALKLQTTTAMVRKQWEKLGGNPTKGQLLAFREANHIWLSCNRKTGQEDIWNMAIGRK